MTAFHTKWFVFSTVAALTVFGAAAAYANLPDSLAKAPPWQAPTAEEVKTKALSWLKQSGADAETLARGDALWADAAEDATQDDLLERLAGTFALADKNAASLMRLCSAPKDQLVLPEQPWLTDPQTAPPLAHNMRLLYGRWLVHQEMFDEALSQLTSLEPGDVVAPALLLFYQSVAHHTLLEKDAGLKAIGQLLDGMDQSPRRYIALAELMQQDLEGLNDDTLDHIARRMKDVRRRLDLGRGGKKVREVEDGVIESLDKLIKKLEEQQKNQQNSGGMRDNIRSTRPAPDSMPIGGKGAGDVDKRPIGSKSGWGDLPPREREEALHALGRDFPSNYRDIIEQYFRKMADQENK